MIAALFQHVPVCLTALDEESVLTMTYVNARRSGLVTTVPSSPVHLLTIALVGVLSFSLIAIFQLHVYKEECL